jgi:hypothetical protein
VRAVTDVHRGSVILLALSALLASCSGGPPSPGAPQGASGQPTTPGPAPSRAAESAAASPQPSLAPSPAPTVGAPEPPEAADLAWEPLATAAGPAAREDHTWTLDGAGERAYLFGGRSGEPFGDLWSYDFASDTWSELTPPSPTPPARFGHEAVWVEGIGLVVFAGQAGSTFFDDLWVYEPPRNRWVSLPPSGSVPVARYGTCSGVGPDGRLWISHGFTSDGVRFSDTRAYDFSGQSWTDVTPVGEVPVSRCLHACWWTDAGQFTLYAGQTTGVTALGDLWRLDAPGTAGAAWRQDAAEALPPERNLPATARWDAGTLAFGGQSIDGGFLADAWYMPDDGAPSALEPAGADATGPTARAGATLVADPERGRLLLFGGRNAEGALADIWALAGQR